ncbi:MAG: indolepyruvate oxidoreductase subunit beta [Clostridia bacterium]|nr:indolepyruvate oxidoreductase subunit beta [Clostridia bacterium]MBR6784050.1 indolepyruvate oxidoreductase subunit beta [Clostridia bacterium]
MNSINILIVGVGGQGTLLASKLMGKIYIDSGYDVKVSEVHGMSQRGGSVVTYVRAGEKVYSPVIDKGEADVIISFEALESARWLPYLKKGGVIISNTAQIDPMPVIMGNAEYPENILEKISALGVKVVSADALSLAEQAGSAKAVNIVLLGIAAKQLGIDKQECLDAIRATVPQKTIEVNERAFELGYSHE